MNGTGVSASSSQDDGTRIHLIVRESTNCELRSNERRFYPAHGIEKIAFELEQLDTPLNPSIVAKPVP